MSRLARPADRIATGSAAVARRLGARAAAWVRRGRRNDLTGWRAALGCWLRIALLGLGLYLLWRLVRALPNLMWLLSAGWLIAAWRAGKPTPTPAAVVEPAEEPVEDPEETPAKASPQEVVDATREWIRQQIGDRQGVHLRDLLAHAQAHGMFEDLDVTTFRAHLERWGIPVRSRCRVRGLGVTVGIHRDDLAPSPTAPSGDAPQESPKTEPHTS